MVLCYIDERKVMINFLKQWSNQIIVAVIVSTIIEMILPEGNNKKYIKMIIGIYILFTILHPVIGKFTQNNKLEFDYSKYFPTSAEITTSSSFEDENSKLIQQTYIDSIKKDINTKILAKGYKVISCKVDMLQSGDDYGTINSLSLELTKKQEKVENKTNNIQINQIQINENKSSNKEDRKKVNENEKKEIIEYLSNEYSIKKDKIFIN